MPSTFASPYLLPIVLLLGSNMFMTLAWYGHLRFKAVPLIGVIVASWLIAFVEYCAAVPANRWGSAVYTTAQLKTIQEVVTLLVFAGFSIVYLKEPLTWNYAVGFVLIALGAFFVFHLLVMIAKGGDRHIGAAAAQTLANARRHRVGSNDDDAWPLIPKRKLPSPCTGLASVRAPGRSRPLPRIRAAR